MIKKKNDSSSSSRKNAENNKELDLSKVWLSLFILFDIFILIGYWMFKNIEVAAFLLEHPIIILPYLTDKYGIVKIIGVAMLVIVFIVFIVAMPSAKKKKKSQTIRGTELLESNSLEKIMRYKCVEEIEEEIENSQYISNTFFVLKNIRKKTLAKKVFKRNIDNDYIKIGNVPIPHKLENRGFFFFGDPGTGKSQSIKQTLQVLKGRSDFRGMVFDRNGEMTKHFYNPERDVIYNPFDQRTVDWCHTYEEGVRPETIAEALIAPPLPNSSNPFFPTAAAAILGEIFRKAKTNQQVFRMLTKPDEEIASDLEGTIAVKYVAEPKLASSVISTANNFCKFYRYLDNQKNEKISFFNWAYKDDPRWVFVTLKENDAPLLKPLHSMLFELMLKGLLSNQNRTLKTAIVIDELGALNRLDSLGRLASEGRKFKVCPFLGTQTQAQITKTYKEEDTSILLQGALIKLMLRCSDPKTAETMSQMIGKRELLRYKTSTSKTPATFMSPSSKTETTTPDYSESFAVLPSEIQNEQDLRGYLRIGGLNSTVQLQYQHFADNQPDFIDCSLD